MPGPSNHASRKKRKGTGTAQKSSKSSGAAGKGQGQQQRGQNASGSEVGTNSTVPPSAVDVRSSSSTKTSGNYTDTSSIIRPRNGSSASAASVKSRTSGTGHDIHRHHPHRQSPPSRHSHSHSHSHGQPLPSSQSSSAFPSNQHPSHSSRSQYQHKQSVSIPSAQASASFAALGGLLSSPASRQMPPQPQISSPLSFAPPSSSLPLPPPAPKGSRSSGLVQKSNNSHSTGRGRTKTGSLDLGNSSNSPKRGRSLVRRRTTNSHHCHGHPQVPIASSQLPPSSHLPSASTSGLRPHEAGPSHDVWNTERKPLSVAITPLLVPHHRHHHHTSLGVGSGDRSKPSSCDSGSSPSTSQILTPSPPLDLSSLSHADSDHLVMAESETDMDTEAGQLFGVRILRVVRQEAARVTHSFQVEGRNRFGDDVFVESGYESMEVERERKQRERQKAEQARVAERVRIGNQRQQQEVSEHLSRTDEETQSQEQTTEEEPLQSIVSSSSLRALLWPDLVPSVPWEDTYLDISMEERTQLSVSSSRHHPYRSPSSQSPSRTTSESYHSAYSPGVRPPSTSSSQSRSHSRSQPRLYTHPDPDARYRSYSYSRSLSPDQYTGSRSCSRSPSRHQSRSGSRTRTGSPASDWFHPHDPNRAGPRSVNFNLVETPDEPLDEWDEEIIDKITPCLHDPGNGVRVKDIQRFLDSYFAQEPALHVPLCAEFAQQEMLEMLTMVLPEEIALILWYNKSRLTSRICPACRRLYTLGDHLPSLTPEEEDNSEPEPQYDEDEEYYYPRRKPMSPYLMKEQELSGLCSPICFIFCLFNNPLAIKPAWGHTAHEMDHWAWDQLNGPGDNILGPMSQDQFKMGTSLCLLVRMTRLADLGLGQLCFGQQLDEEERVIVERERSREVSTDANTNRTRTRGSRPKSNPNSNPHSRSSTTKSSPRHSRRNSESEREEEEGRKLQREVMELLRGVSITIGPSSSQEQKASASGLRKDTRSEDDSSRALSGSSNSQVVSASSVIES